MAETKSKKAADKFFDVAKPGKSTPSSTSRPVIITNRPVLKDPMVIRVDTGDEDSGTSPATDTTPEMKHKVDIKPLHIDLESVLAPSAPEVKKNTKKAAAKTTDKPAVEAETPPASEEAPADTPEPDPQTTSDPIEDTPAVSSDADDMPTPEKVTDSALADDKPAEKVQRTREKVIAPPVNDSPETKTTDKPAVEAETPPASEEAPADTPEPDPQTTSDPIEDSISDSEPSLDNSDTPVLSEKESKAAAEAKKVAEEQEKIIASGQYYLPINAVSKRRTKRNLMIGTVLVLLLLVAAALAAWDANLFSIPGVQAPTNFL